VSSPPPGPRARPRLRDEIPRSGLAAIVVDVALPLVLYYVLRVAGVEQLWALLLSGAPPAVRNAIVFARTRRIDAIGALVILAVVLGALSSLVDGDPRALLVRDALIGVPFAAWLFLSLRARRPLTYEVAKAVLPNREEALERAWASDPGFRLVWRRISVLWGVGTLVNAGACLAMAYALPVDLVPGLETALWVALFVVLQAVTFVLLRRAGAMRMVFAAP
jgi:hypothetical protein